MPGCSGIFHYYWISDLNRGYREDARLQLRQGSLGGGKTIIDIQEDVRPTRAGHGASQAGSITYDRGWTEVSGPVWEDLLATPRRTYGRFNALILSVKGAITEKS